jgi:hypothetical protein
MKKPIGKILIVHGGYGGRTAARELRYMGRLPEDTIVVSPDDVPGNTSADLAPPRPMAPMILRPIPYMPLPQLVVDKHAKFYDRFYGKNKRRK